MLYNFSIISGAMGQNFTIEVPDESTHEEVWEKAIQWVKDKKYFNGNRGIYCRGYKKNKSDEWIDTGFIKNMAYFHIQHLANEMLKQGKDPIPYLKILQEMEHFFKDGINYKYFMANIQNRSEYKTIERKSKIERID